jgi:hypothetical protein
MTKRRKTQVGNVETAMSEVQFKTAPCQLRLTSKDGHMKQEKYLPGSKSVNAKFMNSYVV